jgi:hypothetical protein
VVPALPVTGARAPHCPLSPTYVPRASTARLEPTAVRAQGCVMRAGGAQSASQPACAVDRAMLGTRFAVEFVCSGVAHPMQTMFVHARGARGLSVC